MVASSGEDKTIRLWELASGKQRCIFLGHPTEFWSVAFSPDARTLALGGEDGTIRLWCTITGKLRVGIKAHSAPIRTVVFSPDGKLLASCSHDGAITLWDMPATEQPGPNTSARAGGLPSEEQESLWSVLAGEDATAAYQAIRTFISASYQSVSFLKDRLQPCLKPTSKDIALLIADLDSNSFVVRRKATKELEGVGDPVVPALRKKLAENPSLELRHRIEQLLDTWKPLSGDFLRGVRAVEVLENIGSPEAMKVLEKLATGAEDARLTRELDFCKSNDSARG